MVLSSPFGCRSTLPHLRQHLLVRNSDTATTSTLLLVVGSPSQDLCNPSHLELSQSCADAIQAFQTKRLSVDLSCWWSFQEMLGCLKCHKQAMMKTMKTMKIHQSMVLWEKNVHRAFSAVLLVLTVG